MIINLNFDTEKVSAHTLQRIFELIALNSSMSEEIIEKKDNEVTEVPKATKGLTRGRRKNVIDKVVDENNDEYESAIAGLSVATKETSRVPPPPPPPPPPLHISHLDLPDTGVYVEPSSEVPEIKKEVFAMTFSKLMLYVTEKVVSGALTQSEVENCAKQLGLVKDGVGQLTLLKENPLQIPEFFKLVKKHVSST